MNGAYKILVGKILGGIIIGILAMRQYPNHRIEILVAVPVALWAEITFGELMRYVSLKKLQTIKKKLHENWLKIDLEICFIMGRYGKYRKRLIKSALQKVQSDDENDRKMGIEQLSQFEGEEIYKKLVEILKTKGGLCMETKKILWIDYDSDMLMGLVRPLEKDGYKIIVAKDEKEALEMIDKFSFKLILCDIIIPTCANGDEEDVPFVGMRLLKTLLKDMEIETPIIVLSVVSDRKKIDEMHEMGVKRVLQKSDYLPSKLKKEVYDTLDVRK